MNKQQMIKDNLVCEVLTGSQAYGTSLPTSDTDTRGIFVAPAICIRTPFFKVREVEDKEKEDTKFYELTNFMKLLVDQNPNILEILWVNERDVLISTPTYEYLRANRSNLLSSKLAHTFSGYAHSQLLRIKGHHKWINNPQPKDQPRLENFMSVLYNLTSIKKYNKEVPLQGFFSKQLGGHFFALYSDNGLGSKWLDKNGNPNPKPNEFFEKSVSSNLTNPALIVKVNIEQFTAANENWKNYWTWKENRNEQRSKLEEEFGYDCYTDDTEFLTDNGWKLFDDVNETDTLATFNQLSHKIEYQVPKERIENLYTGNLYHLTGFHVDTLVSANHNMFVRPHSRNIGKTGGWTFARAAELPETFDTLNVITPKINRRILPTSFNQTVLEHVNLLDYLRLIGWYVSDGTMIFRDSEVKSMVITQSKPQSRLTQTLTKQINYGKIKASEYVYEARGLSHYPERRWHFNCELSKLIFDDCGHKSETKRLPSWCFFLARREMTTLLVALLQGDGTQRNHQAHTHIYYSINSLLADDVQRLAFLCGFETSKYGPYNSTTSLGDLTTYQVHINMRPPKTRRHIRYQSVKKKYVERQRIVCFMVDNLTLVTRHNGQIGLHANTKHAMHLVRLLKMGKEALTDGIILVKRPDAQELLDIRHGKWSYEEIVQYAEHLDAQVKALYETTSLPRSVDTKFAANLLMELQDMEWGKDRL